MKWVINFIWDYFKCKECDKYKLREQELLCLVNQLIKSQNELLEFMKVKSE